MSLADSLRAARQNADTSMNSIAGSVENSLPANAPSPPLPALPAPVVAPAVPAIPALPVNVPEMPQSPVSQIPQPPDPFATAPMNGLQGLVSGVSNRGTIGSRLGYYPQMTPQVSGTTQTGMQFRGSDSRY